ncbi:hypothetical protein B5M09_005910 [Aphanomyces astaci]|uniref:Uncharacterized protein n=1 Tax=Aphanomyces astaci TaxID=112090 RepID=A0A3R7YE68_APHAT|nr:hypothetical protein B5M09_005910 [Aphanomyces astaci]
MCLLHMYLLFLTDNVAAIFYSLEKRQFVCDFVAANASSRLSMKLHHCQKNRLFGVTVVDTCTWVQPDEASPVNIPDSTYYTVYHSGQVWGGRAMCWVKFTWRCALGVYILWLMWRVYYRHYGPLVRNLRAIGLDTQCHTYQVKEYIVDVGDPKWLILSHPIVVVGMTVDCIVGAAYLGVATIRVTQVTDVTEFAVGCLYGSRTVRIPTHDTCNKGGQQRYEATLRRANSTISNSAFCLDCYGALCVRLTKWGDRCTPF